MYSIMVNIYLLCPGLCKFLFFCQIAYVLFFYILDVLGSGVIVKHTVSSNMLSIPP